MKIREETVPAPRTTLVIPLHMVNAPSVLAIRDTACVIPVYTAAGVGLTTCIRVYNKQPFPIVLNLQSFYIQRREGRTLIASIG